MKTRILFPAAMLILISLIVATCGGGGAANQGAGGGESGGDTARGEELFNMTTIGPSSAPGCTTCHSLEEGVTKVGPSLANIGTEAGEMTTNMSAAEFIHQSIVDPNAQVTEGFSAGIMYQNYEQGLTDQQINDLVAFLLTQK